MGVVLTIGCYLVAFSPASIMFYKFISKDPLRIILFVLGAFFWLLSLLLSGLFWFVLFPYRDVLAISVTASIIFQEAVRVLCFVLLKKAQHGLHKMAASGSGVRVSGVTDLQNARHMLALVCGLGMGTIAALFLTMNVFASFSGPGSIGLPAALPEAASDLSVRLTAANSHLPLYYAISGCALTLLHPTWTIQMWDSCHKMSSSVDHSWMKGSIVAMSTHVLVSAASFFNEAGHQVTVLVVQLLVLVGNILFCAYLMGATPASFANALSTAGLDCMTLKCLRSHCTQKTNTDAQAHNLALEVDAGELQQSSAQVTST